jgi:hypothetical protein
MSGTRQKQIYDFICQFIQRWFILRARKMSGLRADEECDAIKERGWGQKSIKKMH